AREARTFDDRRRPADRLQPSMRPPVHHGAATRRSDRPRAGGGSRTAGRGARAVPPDPGAGFGRSRRGRGALSPGAGGGGQRRRPRAARAGRGDPGVGRGGGRGRVPRPSPARGHRVRPRHSGHPHARAGTRAGRRGVGVRDQCLPGPLSRTGRQLRGRGADGAQPHAGGLAHHRHPLVQPHPPL
ncbi:MAG: hypothetical protein AVDCRST_MAG89-3407, partial [uncultured Gemmatimonadetes bacterium]